MNDPYKNCSTLKKLKNARVCFAAFSIRGELPIFIKKLHNFLVNITIVSFQNKSKNLTTIGITAHFPA